jgi:D-tagatose-1,6-bisphosphate aldolase subunit GatZ/KbaZ
MYREHPLKELVRQQKKGIPKGICSICSSHPYVIEASIEKAIAEDTYVLIESTANQVNQFGGYTGMMPQSFADHVKGIARRKGLHKDRLILGGDHLGPLVWKNETEDGAMGKAEELIAQYIKAGFSKIHIDTSMHLGSDPKDRKLDIKVMALRAAKLYLSAEKAFKEVESKVSYHPVYVIGSEVPVPGGAQENKDLKVTEVIDLQDTLNCFRGTFTEKISSSAMENVIAVVVQPGVEFGEGSIHEYSREAAQELSTYIKNESGLVFEGHSTDYQRATLLRQMVEDGIAILKVGPALTFALRESLSALEYIEREMLGFRDNIKLSAFSEILEKIMLENPIYWDKYYHGSKDNIRIARKYSLFDRCRYYLGNMEVMESVKRLIENLETVEIPFTLISQYFPQQYVKIREGTLENTAENILKDKVKNVIGMYPQFRM